MGKVKQRPRRKLTPMHKYIGLLLFCIIGIGVAFFAPRCRAAVTPDFDSMRAWNDLVYQVKAGYRIPDTTTHRNVRDWLVQQLASCVKDVQLQPFTVHANGKDIPMWNIIAFIPGTGQGKADLVLLCAHWDSRPIAEHELLPADQVLPIPGANDGASGVAVLLEIARQLKAHPIARQVEIVLYDGEDYAWPGEDLNHVLDNMLLGSGYFAAHPGKHKPDWGILLDMIGDKDLDIYREPSSELNAKAVNDRIFRAAHELGFMGSRGVSGFYDTMLTGDDGTPETIEDDHTPLNKAGIPTADIIDFHYPAWHTRKDDVAHCSANSLRIVGQTVLYAISAQAD